MAQPLLDFLTGRARTALPFLRAGVNQGLSPTEIIASLQAQGIPTARRQTMLDIIAVLQGNAATRRTVRLLPPNEPIPAALHVTAVTNIKSLYQYTVRVTHPDLLTPQFLTVSSDVPLSRNNILADAQTMFTNGKYTQIEEDSYDLLDLQVFEARSSLANPEP